MRVVGPAAEQLGVVTIQRALDLANQYELDLVEVAPSAVPPVCRIMDFSKYKYDQEKKERRVKKSQHVQHLKQVRLKPNIDDHDYQIKIKQIIGFLEKKDKVKVNLFFQGREMSFRDKWRALLNRVLTDAAPYAQIEKDPLTEGRIVSVVLAPKTEQVAKAVTQKGS